MKKAYKSAYEAPASAVISIQSHFIIMQSAGGGGEQGGGDSMDDAPIFPGLDNPTFPFSDSFPL